MQVDVATVTLPTSGIMGTQAHDGSEGQVQLRASATLKSGVTVKALSTNAASIFVGFTGVTVTTSGATTTGGIELAAKESVFIEVDDPSEIYIRAAAAGVVTYIGT